MFWKLLNQAPDRRNNWWEIMPAGLPLTAQHSRLAGLPLTDQQAHLPSRLGSLPLIIQQAQQQVSRPLANNPQAQQQVSRPLANNPAGTTAG